MEIHLPIVMVVTGDSATDEEQRSPVGRLVLGTAQWGEGYGITNHVGRLTDAAIADILECALAGGIRDVDTHRALRADQGYGDAQSRLARFAGRFRITTKVFAAVDTPIRRQLASSLQDLGVDSVQACLVHDWMTVDDRRAADAARALQDLVEDGLCAHVGVAAYDDVDIIRARRYFGPTVALQVPVSILDQRLIGNPAVENILVDSPLVQVRSVFAQGLLLPHDIPTRWSDHPDVRRWKAYVAEHGLDATRACLGLVRSLTWADGVVVGVVSAEQLQEIIEAWYGPLDTKDWSDFASLDDELVDPRRWRS